MPKPKKKYPSRKPKRVSKKSSRKVKTDPNKIQIAFRIRRSTIDKLDRLMLELTLRNRDTYPQGVPKWLVIDRILEDGLDLDHVEALLVESGQLPE
jgi:hypothetical protein